MKNAHHYRKPQISLQVEAEEKALFAAVASARGMKVAALLKVLAHDEARRLGISLPAKTQ